ncbi:MAG: SWIM zinc finger domain-containing protein [Candidatus Competibacteraceae bacterium]|nr:SWIM zinc finger domain-containing protein [Candidatus Competibacteraceae bacterium]
MTIPQLSESVLRRYANAQSFARGKDYYRSGAVGYLQQRGNTLQAEVEGSEDEPYIVCLTFDEKGVTSADCTCPYSFDGWCKHIVATALAGLHEPESIEERPTLESLLDGLDLAQTRELVQELIAEEPHLIEIVDEYVDEHLTEPASAQPSATAPRRISINPAPFRRAAQQILRNAVRDWESGRDDDSIQYDFEALIAKAQGFIERGDGPNALVAMEAITQACADHWQEVADYGADSDDVVGLLDQAWTEAILSTELTPVEKKTLQQHLTDWQEELGSELCLSQEALRQGWDYPSLQKVFQGHITELGAWDGERPDYADDLAQIRLKILDRQGRYAEYLHLAEAESQVEQYLTMLVRTDQVETTMEAAKTLLSSLAEAFALARALREKGAQAQALAIAQTGLNLQGTAHHQHELAVWASDLAKELNDVRAALATRIKAFNARPSLEDYQIALKLAGDEESTVRTELLQLLRQHSSWDSQSARVGIFLQEGLLDDAITVVKDLGYYQGELVKQVMAAAVHQHPDWVIENACRRAEKIMDAGKANAYHHAVEWLQQAQAAYLASGQPAAWQAYRNRLLERYARKHKLVGMLKQRDLA